MTILYRTLYHALIALGRPIGGIRPRRLYDALGRRAYPRPEFHWTHNRWGHELLLSHHFHLDRNILIYGDYDHELHLLLERRIKPGMTVLDVGANLGEMTLHMGGRVSDGGVVHAFEPFPPAYDRLSAHIQRNGLEPRVHPWQIALSNAPGELSMTVPAPDADNQGIGSIVNSAATGKTQTVQVEALTLDAFVWRERIPKIDFIKLDIQGAEYFFLEGAQKTLRNHRPELVMEISPTDLRAIGKTSRDLLQRIAAAGYDVFTLSNGEPATRLEPDQISPAFAATNVLCIHHR